MNDLVFHNGTIHTLDEAQPRAGALLVRGDRIEAVGDAATIRAAARTGYDSYDLGGRAVVPGLCDAHIHLLWTGLNRQNIDLDGAASLDEARDRIAQHVAGLAPDAWVRGHGWNQSTWGVNWPSADDLDRVTGGRPAVLSRKDGHSVWVNTAALRLAGIDERTPDPDGGEIQRDAQGTPTGILLENANALVYNVVPEPTFEDKLRALRDVIAAANRYGITSMHLPEGPDALAALQALRSQQQLNLRALYNPPVRQLEEYIMLGIRSGLGDEWVRIGGIKIFSDGSLGSVSAHMLEPYVGTASTGIATIGEEALFAAVRNANSNGLAVMIHAIGDRANRTVLDAIEEAARPGTTPPMLPNRIEHAQHLAASDIGRFGALGIVASMQPIHATADWQMAERLIGPERSALSYAWRSLQDGGAVLAFGSDAPVETFDPWAGMHAAVTREGADGQPAGGWHPEQALTIAEALWAYTVGPAITSAETHLKGALRPGLLADLAVLNADPFTVAPTELLAIHADLTMLGGRVVWER